MTIPVLRPGETAGPFEIEIPHEAIVFVHVYRHWPRWRRRMWDWCAWVPPGAWRAAKLRGALDNFPQRP